ncbi:nitronate monooxygenase [Cryobacterium roopkundense]|uniref:Nitronate monooxygenase n=1 Tax=Cryobacterium roopkundense TaxID=1001240 RepID=A0A099J4Y2_9MICO|nr:nitronate monooxygenase [Cryobacterium roopkundense]KGJ73469.1 nitronate monooxygenase [Cryobacterium roopkundense]MBB5641015.1 nitronate monooxygenase [Cryobacterium roopkundense]
MLNTRFTAEFGIKAPIMQGGMQWIGNAELAAAVSNAGGLGTITALTFPTPDALAGQIARCQELTDKPFAVNLTTLPSISPPPYEEYQAVIIDLGVPVVETSGSNPDRFVDTYHAAGIKIVHKATSIRHAVKAQAAGVDAIAMIGFEAAGHPGELDVPLFVLLAAAARTITIPLLAAGGIGNGAGLAAALALGADGVLLATRFMATAEAPIHQRVKEELVARDELQTQLIFRQLRNTARVSANSVSEEVVAILSAGGEFGDVRELVAGRRGRTVYETGDLEAGIWWAGLSQTLIDDIPTCSELIARMVDEAEDIITTKLLASIA